MKSNLRFLENLDLEVERNDDFANVKIPFGRWVVVDRVVRLADDPDYLDVYFNNGDVARGVHMSVVELHGVEVEEEEMSLPDEFFKDEDDDEDGVPALI